MVRCVEILVIYIFKIESDSQVGIYGILLGRIDDPNGFSFEIKFVYYERTLLENIFFKKNSLRLSAILVHIP